DGRLISPWLDPWALRRLLAKLQRDEPGRLTRLGRNGTAPPTNHRMGSAWTTSLVPGGSGRPLARPARRRDRPEERRPQAAHARRRGDRSRPTASVCDLRRRWKGDRTTLYRDSL